MGFGCDSEPPMNINYLGNYGTQCGVINSPDTEQVPLFGKLHKIQLNVAPAVLSCKDPT